MKTTIFIIILSLPFFGFSQKYVDDIYYSPKHQKSEVIDTINIKPDTILITKKEIDIFYVNQVKKIRTYNNYNFLIPTHSTVFPRYWDCGYYCQTNRWYPCGLYCYYYKPHIHPFYLGLHHRPPVFVYTNSYRIFNKNPKTDGVYFGPRKGVGRVVTETPVRTYKRPEINKNINYHREIPKKKEERSAVRENPQPRIRENPQSQPRTPEIRRAPSQTRPTNIDRGGGQIRKPPQTNSRGGTSNNNSQRRRN